MLKKYCRISLAGDSVTDCGRARPFAGRNMGLGNGYAFFVDSALNARNPGLKLWLENAGIGGDTSKSLLARFDTDVLDRKPDVIGILIGINNIWRHFDLGNYFPDELLSIEQYEADMRCLIEKSQSVGAKVILSTPFFIEPDKNNPMRKMCDDYCDVVRRLSTEYGTYFCDLQSTFDKVLEVETTYFLSADRVHPTTAGHFIIAEELLKILEGIEL